MKIIKVGNKFIGDGKPCFIAAEVGLNHNGDMGLAKKTIDAAVMAGADAVKFQNYQTEDFLFDNSLTYTYENNGQMVTESQFDMFKRCELSLAQLQDLNEYCSDRGIIFFSTPTSEVGIQDLIKSRSPILKNGSDYLTNLPLIESMAKTGLPVILSTGMATVEEVDEAVLAFEGAGGSELIILHCTSSYPTPSNEVNLRRIDSLKKKYNHLIGFSDHSWGFTAAIGAVALGASFVEKHFTLDKKMPGPDHRFSSDPIEFGELTTRIRELENNLGSGVIAPTTSEVKSRIDFRLSCVASRNLARNHIITAGDVVFRRPGSGIPPKGVALLVNRKLLKEMDGGESFDLDFLE